MIKPYEQKYIPTDERMKEMLGVPVSDKISTNGYGYLSDWAHSVTYYQSFYAGYDYVQCYSLPYGTWNALDAKNSSIWINSFKIAEHVKYNGATVRSIDNPFKYRNVKLATGVGAKSNIVFAAVDGRLQSYSNGSKLLMKIFEKVYEKSLPLFPSVNDIRGWINAIIDSGTNKEVTLGSSNIRVNSGKVLVEGVNSKNYDMYRWTDINGTSTGHHMVLQTTVQYDSDTLTPATANGVMKIEWEVYYANSLYDSNSKEITFTYNVAP